MEDAQMRMRPTLCHGDKLCSLLNSQVNRKCNCGPVDDARMEMAFKTKQQEYIGLVPFCHPPHLGKAHQKHAPQSRMCAQENRRRTNGPIWHILYPFMMAVKHQPLS
ncbi:hypothetical protein KIN20_001306 [Parelaphostrongylus tenuis]|uniref:Uncharacterized protein n=1 Tax=Parelaphostrongylus tenuis TaxID=148309 RepID=A0AAD5LWU1_PARTN|nr:hypothetical protein KIN20_001306 [Parelaphostrongylus tenuis]